LKLTVAPAAMDCGEANPVSLNPVPVIAAWVIVSVEVPVFFSCTVCEPVEPAVTEPKVTLAGVTLNPACTAVALAAMLSVCPCVVTKATVPFAAPCAAGANCTLSVALCAGAIVVGVVIPLAEYPAPLTVICETLAVVFPMFVTVTFCDAVVPMVTFPKFQLDGVAVSVELVAVPVPDNAIATGEFGALLTTNRLPLKVAAVSGANCAVKVLLCPAPIVSGVVTPVMLNPVPLAVTWLTVKLAVPVFVNVIVCVFVCPSMTLPKLTVAGDALIPA
jgi:hypothetical protein